MQDVRFFVYKETQSICAGHVPLSHILGLIAKEPKTFNAAADAKNLSHMLFIYSVTKQHNIKSK